MGQRRFASPRLTSSTLVETSRSDWAGTLVLGGTPASPDRSGSDKILAPQTQAQIVCMYAWGGNCSCSCTQLKVSIHSTRCISYFVLSDGRVEPQSSTQDRPIK